MESDATATYAAIPDCSSPMEQRTFSTYTAVPESISLPSSVSSAKSLPRPTPDGERIEIQGVVPANKMVRVNIETIPTELTLRVFKLLPKASATCLGLTCPRLYACLKTQYPGPISLGSSDCCDIICKDSTSEHCNCIPTSAIFNDYDLGLARQIKSWMGPQYTLAFVHVQGGYPMFLKSSEYRYYKNWEGNILLAQRPLYRMYRDWVKASTSRCNRWPRHSLSCFDPHFTSRLPKLYINRWEDWEIDAIAAIKADVARFETIEEWREFWKKLYIVSYNRHLFDSMFLDFELDRMSEGLRLLGL